MDRQLQALLIANVNQAVFRGDLLDYLAFLCYNVAWNPAFQSLLTIRAYQIRVRYNYFEATGHFVEATYEATDKNSWKSGEVLRAPQWCSSDDAPG